MAHKAARKTTTPPSSTPTALTPTSASPAAAPTIPSSTAPTAPASAWGGGKANPLLSAASHVAPAAAAAASHPPATANGAAAAAEKSKEKDKDKAAPPASSSSVTTPAPAPSPIPTVSPSSASSAPLSTVALTATLQLGAVVRVTTSLGETLEGVVYVYDPAASILALHVARDSSSDYALLHTAALTRADLVRRSAASPTPRVLPEVDPGKLAMKEARAVAARQTEASKIGVGVSARGQRMFDALAKLYSAAWQGSTIVLMDAMRLDEPYTAETLTGGSEQQRQRIIKTIEHRQHIELQRDSAQTPSKAGK